MTVIAFRLPLLDKASRTAQAKIAKDRLLAYRCCVIQRIRGPLTIKAICRELRVSRKGTGTRSKPTNPWRPFLPVRASASISPAIALNPSASSSSRYATIPHWT